MFSNKLCIQNNQNASNGYRAKIIDSLIANLIGCLGPIIFPVLHIYIIYEYWRQYTHRVDRHYCTCSCWDTVFKGSYESGIASYKHVYFNATRASAKIWGLTVVCVIALYEAFRRLASLLIKRQLRLSMLILFASSVFSHYYTWWSFFNYWNDEFYSQWYHQLFFSLSELLSTCLVLRLADLKVKVTPHAVLPVIAVAVTHIVVAAFDQFIVNVIHGQGSSHQVLRDLGFMVTDVLHILLSLIELFVCTHSPGLHKNCFILCIVLAICFFLFVYYNEFTL